MNKQLPSFFGVPLSKIRKIISWVLLIFFGLVVLLLMDAPAVTAVQRQTVVWGLVIFGFFFLYLAISLIINSKIKRKDTEAKPKKKFYKRWWFWVLIVIAVLIVSGIFFPRMIMSGSSMEPTIKNGEVLILEKSFTPQRGDIVVFSEPQQQLVFSGNGGQDESVKSYFVKRIIGLPGDSIQIQNGKVIVNGQLLNEPYVNGGTEGSSTVTLDNDQFYLMGDNRSVSYDSRSFGAVPRNDITGKVIMEF